MLHKKHSLTLRQWLAALLLFLLFTIGFLTLFTYFSDDNRFRRYTEQLFRSELSSNTLSLHYTLADPDAYDISYPATLPIYDEQTASETLLNIEQALTTLSDFSPDQLHEENAYAYDLLLSCLENRLTLAQYPYYMEPFAPSSGMQSGLPILLADYTFRSKQDVENYLSLLSQIPAYFDGLLLLEKQKSQAGLFMSPYSAEKVIEQCDSILNTNELADGTHFLQVSFAERIQELVTASLLTNEEATLYLAENNRLLTTVVQPAYEQVADTFQLLCDTGVNEKGLYYFPDGRNYYACLLCQTTGSGRSIAEIKELLYQDFLQSYQDMVQLAVEEPALFSILSDFTLTLSGDQPDAMLAHLQQQITSDYPSFPSSDTTQHILTQQESTAEKASASAVPQVTIKQVSSCMEDYTSPAYYLTPPIDDIYHNTIYLNPKYHTDDLTLYTTLAHEGYPGHLYQTVYFQLYMAQNNENPIRNVLNYGGYVEGWALSAELSSYDYVLTGNSSQDALIAYYRLNRKLQLCLYSLLDIAIHYEGADPSQTAHILSQIGITDSATAQAIYEYIVEEPTTYPKYYLGYLELLQLKKQAKLLWGSDFSDTAFHTFLLNAGPSDFPNLTKKLRSSALPRS